MVLTSDSEIVGFESSLLGYCPWIRNMDEELFVDRKYGRSTGHAL